MIEADLPLSALVAQLRSQHGPAEDPQAGPVMREIADGRGGSALIRSRVPGALAPAGDRRQFLASSLATFFALLGGGFIEFLFGGGQQRPEPRVTAVPPDAEPTPEGPGAIERLYEPRREAALPVARRMPAMDEKFLPAEVDYSGNEPPGTVVINTRERFLYLVMPNGKAQRYGIGVGRPGFTWAGVHKVTAKREWPDWTPPAEMRKRQPYLPAHMAGGPNNPLGARALYLGSTLYRIHGSNEPWTIGRAVSSGCIRMRNQDVIDLYGRVGVGAKVVVI
jgi:lipoprotein-anchoring transpeptidase ErfK/SrfK